MKKMILFAMCVLAALALSSCAGVQPAPVEATPGAAPAQTGSPASATAGEDEERGEDMEYGVFTEDISDMKIVIHKKDRMLEVYDGEELAARFHIGLGPAPEGPKQREGDGRTPEGEYYVCVRNAHSRFYLSVGLSYPNIGDAQNALDRSDISREDYDSIEHAINRGKTPPWDTPLGGEIMIHGGGSESDWTAGCISLDNGDMDYIWEHAAIGAPVTILP